MPGSTPAERHLATGCSKASRALNSNVEPLVFATPRGQLELVDGEQGFGVRAVSELGTWFVWFTNLVRGNKRCRLVSWPTNP